MNKKVIEDPEYGYLRIDPLPSAQELEKFYRNDFYSSSYPQLNDSALLNQSDPVDVDFNNYRYKQIIDTCALFFDSVMGLNALDVGCGYGLALQYFRSRGLLTTGIDPSPEAAEHAAGIGQNVMTSGVDSFDVLAGAKFDIVSMLNVLEHLREPGKTLKAIRQSVLADKGILAIDVPNEFNAFQTTANAEYGLNEWWVTPPAHINYFTPSSLSRLLDACGYAIVDMISSFPMELFLLFGEQYVGNGELGKKCHNRRVLFEKNLIKHGKEDVLLAFYKTLAKLELGRQITVYARKK